MTLTALEQHAIRIFHHICPRQFQISGTRPIGKLKIAHEVSYEVGRGRKKWQAVGVCLYLGLAKIRFLGIRMVEYSNIYHRYFSASKTAQNGSIFNFLWP